MLNFCVRVSKGKAIANKQVTVLLRDKLVLESYISQVSAGWI